MNFRRNCQLIHVAEHTLLVTEDGVEVLTARFPNSPGGKVPMPGAAAPANNVANGTTPAVKA